MKAKINGYEVELSVEEFKEICKEKEAPQKKAPKKYNTQKNQKERWTEEEDNYLKENASRKSRKKLANKMSKEFGKKRTVKAVTARLSVLKNGEPTAKEITTEKVITPKKNLYQSIMEIFNTTAGEEGVTVNEVMKIIGPKARKETVASYLSDFAKNKVVEVSNSFPRVYYTKGYSTKELLKNIGKTSYMK